MRHGWLVLTLSLLVLAAPAEAQVKAGKQLPVSVARELITRGRTTKPVTGFKSRAGRSFRARLALVQNEEGKWRVEFDEPWAKEGAREAAVDEVEAAAAASAEDVAAA